MNQISHPRRFLHTATGAARHGVYVLATGGALLLHLVVPTAAEPVQLAFDPTGSGPCLYQVGMKEDKYIRGLDITKTQSLQVRVALERKSPAGHFDMLLEFLAHEATMIRGDSFVPNFHPLDLMGKTIQATVSSSGDVLRVDPRFQINKPDEELPLQILVTLLFVEFPDHPVRPGDKWRREVAPQGGAGQRGGPALSVQGWAEMTLDALETKEGQDIAKLSGRSTLDIRSRERGAGYEGKAYGEMQARVALGSGHVLESTYRMQVHYSRRAETASETPSEFDVIYRMDCKFK